MPYIRNRSYVTLVFTLLTLGCLSNYANAREETAPVAPLASGGKNIVGEKIIYPTRADANVVSAIVTLKPGEETGWHTHAVPLFGYVLQGDLEISYRGHKSKKFTKGDSLLEAMTVAHNGRNIGTTPVRILVVLMSAKGIEHTTPEK